MAGRALSRDSAVEMSRFCASANFRRTARVVTRHYDAALRTAGITATQLPLLAAIGSGTADASITALSEALDLERSTVSRDLETLQRLGLVVTAAGADRRTTALKLTARGVRTLKAAHRAWQRAHEAIIQTYGRQPYETLIADARELGRRVQALGTRRKRAPRR